MVDKCAVSIRKRRVDCEDPPEPLEPCPPVEFCAGNKTVMFDGRCLTVEDRQFQIPDGSYSLITFQDGCIVAVGNLPEPQYTPNDCCGPAGADPTPGADVCLSGDPSNLLEMSGECLLVKPTIIGRGVSVEGVGTATDPWIITANPSDGSTVFIRTNTPEQLDITGSGDTLEDPIIISLKPVVTSGKYGPFTVNEYGQIIDYTGQDDTTVVTKVTGIPPINVTTTALGEAVISYSGTGGGTGPTQVAKAVPLSAGDTSVSVQVAGPPGMQYFFDGNGVDTISGRHPPLSSLTIGASGSDTVSVPIIAPGTRGAVTLRAAEGGAALDGFVV